MTTAPFSRAPPWVPWPFAVAALLAPSRGWCTVRDRLLGTLARPHSTHVSVTRGASGCVLHIASGEVSIDAADCSELQCEPGIVSTFAHARVGVIAGLFALYAFGTLAWAARWRALLSFAGIELSVAKVWRISIEAQAGGILLPGGLGGDALRIASVAARPTIPGEARAPVSIVVASVLLDRAVGLSLIAAVAALMGVVVRAACRPAAGRRPGRDSRRRTAGAWSSSAARRPPLVARLSAGRGAGPSSPVLAYLRDARAPRAHRRRRAQPGRRGGAVRGHSWPRLRGRRRHDGREVGLRSARRWRSSSASSRRCPGGRGTADGAAYVFFFGLGGIASGAPRSPCLRLFRLFWYLSGIVGALCLRGNASRKGHGGTVVSGSALKRRQGGPNAEPRKGRRSRTRDEDHSSGIVSTMFGATLNAMSALTAPASVNDEKFTPSPFRSPCAIACQAAPAAPVPVEVKLYW